MAHVRSTADVRHIWPTLSYQGRTLELDPGEEAVDVDGIPLDEDGNLTRVANLEILDPALTAAPIPVAPVPPAQPEPAAEQPAVPDIAGHDLI